MTPEQHYERGLELLAAAERAAYVGAAHTSGVLAQTHFSAAVAGAAMRMFAIPSLIEPAPREHDHERCITPEGVAEDCPDFGG